MRKHPFPSEIPVKNLWSQEPEASDQELLPSVSLKGPISFLPVLFCLANVKTSPRMCCENSQNLSSQEPEVLDQYLQLSLSGPISCPILSGVRQRTFSWMWCASIV